jgi:hypothetical protein
MEPDARSICGPVGTVVDMPIRVTQHGDDPATDVHLEVLAGKDGAQEWVPVPVGHWLVHPPGDLANVWPVEDAYFRAKYETLT